MSDYRELFERLSRCNLPAGVVVEYRRTTLLGSPLVSANGICVSMNYRRPDECRSALMLIVDALRKEGWAFEFGDGVGYYAKAHHVAPIAVLGCRSHMRVADDEVTALAECLIAALGVKE